MAAKILYFPTKQTLDEENKDQYEPYYANEDLANSNANSSIQNTTNWIQNEKVPTPSSDDTITIPVGFIQFILFIIAVVVILVLCFFGGRFLNLPQ